MIGRVYLDPGDRLSGYRTPPEPVTVVARWGPGGGPRNVAVRRRDGRIEVIPFTRRLRRPLVLTQADAAQIRETVWPPALRERFASAPGLFTDCACRMPPHQMPARCLRWVCPCPTRAPADPSAPHPREEPTPARPAPSRRGRRARTSPIQGQDALF